MEKVREHSVTSSIIKSFQGSVHRVHWLCALIGLVIFLTTDVYSQSLRLQKTLTVTNPAGNEFTDFFPSALSVSANGIFYISDLSQNRILKLSVTSQLLETQGRFGWQPEEYDQPTDLVLAQNLNLFVADFNNSRLQQYDRNMNFIRTIPLESSDSGILYYPKSVDQSPGGWLYVLDAKQNQLLRLNPQGDVIQSIGTFAQMGSELQNAHRIRVHPNSDVWVLSDSPGRIKIFDQFGTPSRTLQDSLIPNPTSVIFYKNEAVILNRNGTIVRYSGEAGYKQLLSPVVMDKRQEPVDISRSKDSIYLLLRNPVEIHQLRYQSGREN